MCLFVQKDEKEEAFNNYMILELSLEKRREKIKIIYIVCLDPYILSFQSKNDRMKI